MKQRFLSSLLMLMFVFVAKAQVNIIFLPGDQDSTQFSSVVLASDATLSRANRKSFSVYTADGARMGNVSFTQGKQYDFMGMPIEGSFGKLTADSPITAPGDYYIEIEGGALTFVNFGANEPSRYDFAIFNKNNSQESTDSTSTQLDYSDLDLYISNANSYLTDTLANDSKYEDIYTQLNNAISIATDARNSAKEQRDVDEALENLAEILGKVKSAKAEIDSKQEGGGDGNKDPEPETISYDNLRDKYNECYAYVAPMSDPKYREIKEDLLDLMDMAFDYYYYKNAESQKEIDSLIDQMDEALKQLEKDREAIDNDPSLTNFTDLDNAISSANSFYLQIRNDNTEIAAALKEAIDAAVAVRETKGALQPAVDQATSTLETATNKAKADVKAALDTTEFYDVYNAAKTYYEEISETHSKIASEFQRAYTNASIDITWGFANTQKEINDATDNISKLTRQAQRAVQKEEAGYDINELSKAISDATVYYNNIVADHSKIAASLREAINSVEEAKKNVSAQADVDNAVVAVQNALATAITAVQEEVGEEKKLQSLAYITYTDGNNYRRKQYAYDEEGRVTQALGLQYNSNSNTWQLDTCYIYEYPDQYTTVEYGKIERRDQTILIGNTPTYAWEWMHKRVTVKTEKAIEEKIYYYNRKTEQWEDEASYVSTTELDAQGRKVREFVNNYYLYEYEYDGNKKTKTTYSCWDGTGNYTPNRREVEEKDINGNVILKINYNLINNKWIAGDKREYFYTEDNVYVGQKSYGFNSDGSQAYVSDDTYRVEYDDQGRVIRKISNRNDKEYSNIVYNGFVATETVGSEKQIIRVIDAEGNLTRYTYKDRYSTLDVRYEYDRNVLAEDVIGGVTYLREPNQSEYDSPTPDQVNYKLKYALARKIVSGVLKDNLTIYSLQPTTVQPVQYDLEAEEPTIVIPIATINDKIDVEDGAVIEIVDEAGNVVYEATIEKGNPETATVDEGCVYVNEVFPSYHQQEAVEFNEQEYAEFVDTTTAVKANIRAYRAATRSSLTESEEATEIAEGRYFVQIGGGAVAINGKPVNQISASLLVEKAGEETSVEPVSNGTQSNAKSGNGKYMEDGKIIIIKNGKKYTLSGFSIQ